MPARKKKKREPWKVIRDGSVEVTIYQEKAGFRVTWYFAGKRERKFFVEAKEADSFAKQKATSLGSARPKGEAENDEDLRYLRQLRQRLGETPLHVAVDFFLQHNAKAKLAPALIQDVLAELAGKMREDKKSPGYVQAFERYLQPIATALPRKMHTLSAAELDACIRNYSESSYTRYRMASYLKTLFNWARDVKKALPKGETEADFVNMPDPKPGEIRIYTPEEMRLLLTFAKDDHERALLALGGFVGLRNSEITGEFTGHGALPIASILFDAQAVKVVQKVQLRAVTRFAPLLPNARSWLEPLRGKAGSAAPFPRAGRVIGSIVERINQAHEDDPDWVPMRPKRNGLRRSHISYRTAITRDVPRVADECNTSPEKIRLHYRQPGLEEVAHRWYAITPPGRSLPDSPTAIGGASSAVRNAGS